MKIAVFDIGTNSIHLLIVRIAKDLSYEVLGHEKDTTRVGDGSFRDRRISKDAFLRALEVIDRFAKIARAAGVRRTIAVATSAVRESQNGGDFVNAVYEKTGIRVQVVTGEEEARLIGLGARSSLETRGRKTLILDIGGGSLEFILSDAKKDYLLESHQLGVTRLADKFFRKDPPSKKELRRLASYVESTLKPAARRIRRIGFHLFVATSGTAINLASLIHEETRKRPLKLVNHFEFSRKELQKLHEKISRMSFKERLNLKGLDPRRADIIVSGSALMLAILKILKRDRVVLSDKNIREGIILDFIEKNKKRLKAGEEDMSVRERSVLQLARRYDCDEDHAVQVARLAVGIFEKTERLHKLGEKDKEILWFAAILHDVGHRVSFRRHQKHSYYLIVNSDLDGFTPEEVHMMGELARLHRKEPKLESSKGNPMNGKDRRRILALGSILRIADGLDRTHFSVVQKVDVRIRSKKVRFRVHAAEAAELEIWQARERSDLFSEVFRKKAEFVRVAVRRLNRKGKRHGRL